MPKKTLTTSVSEDLYNRVKFDAERRQVSNMKWLEAACEAYLSPEKKIEADIKAMKVEISDDGKNWTEITGKATAPHNPVWEGKKLVEV